MSGVMLSLMPSLIFNSSKVYPQKNEAKEAEIKSLSS
jgi:hypothetical protein